MRFHLLRQDDIDLCSTREMVFQSAPSCLILLSNSQLSSTVQAAQLLVSSSAAMYGVWVFPEHVFISIISTI
jgi:hypothetical protein